MTFNEALEKYQLYAYRLAFRILCKDEDARDAVQEAFIKIWKHWDKYDQQRNFTTWLCKIVTNVCLDQMKSGYSKNTFHPAEGTVEKMSSDDQDVSKELSNEQLAELIKEISQDLPEKQRIVFVLRDLQDIEIAEISEITNMKPDQIKANLCIARKTIREKLIRINGIKKEDYEMR